MWREHTEAMGGRLGERKKGGRAKGCMSGEAMAREEIIYRHFYDFL